VGVGRLRAPAVELWRLPAVLRIPRPPARPHPSRMWIMRMVRALPTFD
jgi:hypothetical protein